MSHVTIRVPDHLIERVDVLAETDEFESRSDVIREGTRRLVLSHEVRDRTEPVTVEALLSGGSRR